MKKPTTLPMKVQPQTKIIRATSADAWTREEAVRAKELMKQHISRYQASLRAMEERERDRPRLLELQRSKTPTLRAENVASQFFRLPLEIRQDIYKMGLPGVEHTTLWIHVRVSSLTLRGTMGMMSTMLTELTSVSEKHGRKISWKFLTDVTSQSHT